MTVPPVRELLRRHGLAAHRERGQNFLLDEALAVRLVTLAGVSPDDGVVEIGTGLGILTRALAARARRVVTVEVDAGLVRAIRAEGLVPEAVELVHADALEVDLGALVKRAGPPVRVVANLPYSVSAPILRRLLDLRDRLEDWSVMLQRDVADRLLAEPGTRDYGSLAVLHRLSVEVARTHTVGPRCFFPVPRVDSSFVRMVPRRPPVLRAKELEVVERVARAAFGARRKTLANALRGGGIEAPGGRPMAALLEALGIDPRQRAEGLSAERFLELARVAVAGHDAPQGSGTRSRKTATPDAARRRPASPGQ